MPIWGALQGRGTVSTAAPSCGQQPHARVRSNGNDAYTLRAIKRDKSGTYLPFRWGQEDDVPLRGVSNAPPALQVLDVNRRAHGEIQGLAHKLNLLGDRVGDIEEMLRVSGRTPGSTS